MNYSEITVLTTSDKAELIAYFLQEVCIDGVGIYDKKDFDVASWDYKDSNAEKVYGDEVKVKGYCKVEDTESVLCFLRLQFEKLTDCGSLKISVATVGEDDWVKPWQETFRPIETDKLVICPEWLTVETDKKVLMLDTGIAFGTGQHETTSMCVNLAQQLNLENKTVLDIGCGSGILGLSAVLLGASFCTLIDIDSQATSIALHNAQINNLQQHCKIICGDLTEDVSGKFDIVFANLTADILAILYNGISDVVKNDAHIILSGILDEKLTSTTQLYSQKFEVIDTIKKGEWCALHLLPKTY